MQQKYNLHIHKIWIGNFTCQRQFSCNLAAILKNDRLPGGHGLKMLLYGLYNIGAKLNACIIKCTICQICLLRSSTIIKRRQVNPQHAQMCYILVRRWTVISFIHIFTVLSIKH
jgi:hypothetical protein